MSSRFKWRKCGSIQQPADIANQAVQALLLLTGTQLHEHSIIGVRIERLVSVLQLDLLAIEAQVMQSLDQLSELAQRFAITLAQLRVGTEQFNQLRGLQRDELRVVFRGTHEYCPDDYHSIASRVSSGEVTSSSARRSRAFCTSLMRSGRLLAS